MRAPVALALASLLFGCNALLDIDHIEFGEPSQAGSASGGQGSGAAMGGQGAVAGSPSSREICHNGVDDDDDGLVDCADDSCSCAPEAPSNWSGPVVLSLGAGAVGCPADWPAELQAGWTSVSADDLTCEVCSCGSPQGVQCGATINYHVDSSCSGSPERMQSLTTTQGCVALANAPQQFQSVRPGTASVTAGSCAPSGGGVDAVPSIAFGDDAVLCGGAAEGDGCGAAGDVCVALPPAPYQATVCIYRTGGGGCPNGSPYSQPHAFFGDYDDSRDCSSCGCSTAGLSCNATTQLFGPSTNVNCASNPVTVSNNNSCFNNAPQPGSAKLLANNLSGACTTTGGAPTGGVSGEDPVTVCCLP
jgi:hypothetical protein